jgi:hypothetical protein
MRRHLPIRGLPLICADQRLRWTPRMLVSVAVMMAWHSAATMREAFAAARENVVAMYATRRRPGKSLAGFLKTLQRRSEQLLVAVTASLRSSLMRFAGKHWRWREWVVLGVDGSRINCPRTAANEEKLGCAGRRKTGPQLQLTTLYHVATGLPWSWRRGSGKTPERSQLRDMLKDLPKNTLLLADAGFTGYDLMRELIAAGHSFVIRAGRNLTLLRELDCTVKADGDLVHLWPRNLRKRPPLPLRLIQVESDGKRMALLTNLPESALSQAEATRLYRRRWELEVMFRSLKQTMEKRTLCGDTPTCAGVELDWAMIGLWLLGLMTIEACGLKTPWSPAKTQTAVREAMRRCKQRVRRHALRNKFRHAVRDRYERQGSKKARNWPHKKKERPPGMPKTRKATKKEVAAAKALKHQREAA